MAEAAAATLAPTTASTPAEVALTPGGVITRRGGSTPFEVHLDVFSGPFDLLLGLISKHKLDITEIALAKVTDEFIAHITCAPGRTTEWDLGQASEFLLVAATLLDIKAARLLPPAEPAGRGGPRADRGPRPAVRPAAAVPRLQGHRRAFAERMATAGRMTPAQAGLEPQFAALLPELVMGVTPEQLAMIAAPGHDAARGPDRRAGPPARAGGQRARAGRDGRAAAAA